MLRVLNLFLFRRSILTVAICLSSLSGICQKNADSNTGKRLNPIIWGIDTDMNSKYLWRGIAYNDGLVLQPNLWIGSGNLTAGVWGSLTVFDRFQEIRRNEIDLFVNYDFSIGKLELSPGAMVYFYPNQDDSPATGELYFTLGYPIGNFTVISTATIDFITYPGALFCEHGLEYEGQITQRMTGSSSIYAGWANGRFNDTYIGLNKTTCNLVGARIGLTYSTDSYLYFNPHLEINRIANNEIEALLGRYPWFVGLLIGIEF